MGHSPGASAAFVAAMEDILEVYQRPYESETSPGLRRRDVQATHCRNARADRGETQDSPPGMITNTGATGRPICS